ncbi:MAG TPA: methyltransferase domain-containing protein [Streptosporangiaceae bacterium]
MSAAERGPTRPDIRAAYDASAAAWAAGPERGYRRFANALLSAAAAAGLPIGPVVLDLGAGTGAAGRAALAAGASRVVSADVAVGMLRRCGPSLHPVAGDAAALPFRDGAADLVVTAFAFSHLPDLAGSLAEIRRVGRALAAASFAADGNEHPAREIVDEVLCSFGYQPPAWYGWLKNQTEKVAGDPDSMRELARMAGFTDVRLTSRTVPTGLSTPAELAGWRLGMATVAPFAAGLEPRRRTELRVAAEGAVAAAGCPPLIARLLVLTGR